MKKNFKSTDRLFSDKQKSILMISLYLKIVYISLSIYVRRFGTTTAFSTRLVTQYSDSLRPWYNIVISHWNQRTSQKLPAQKQRIDLNCAAAATIYIKYRGVAKILIEKDRENCYLYMFPPIWLHLVLMVENCLLSCWNFAMKLEPRWIIWHLWINNIMLYMYM